MGAEFQCPHCAQAYALSDEQAPQYAGQRIACTKCGREFVVPRWVADPQPRSSASSAAAAAIVPQAQTQLIGQPPTYGSTTPPAAGDPRFAQPPPPPPPDWMQPPTGAMAIGSLISAIIGICIPIIPSLLAMVFGAIALSRARDRRMGGRGMAIAGIVIGAVGLILNIFLLTMIAIPQWQQAQNASGRERCAEHLSATGKLLLAYAKENGGRFPDRLEQLKSVPGFDTGDLACPAAAKAIGNRNYVYVGAGLTTSSPPECVLLYEPLEYHEWQGMNVLFVDGRVSFIGEIEAGKAIPRLKKGRNPPWTITGN